MATQPFLTRISTPGSVPMGSTCWPLPGADGNITHFFKLSSVTALLLARGGCIRDTLSNYSEDDAAVNTSPRAHRVFSKGTLDMVSHPLTSFCGAYSFWKQKKGILGQGENSNPAEIYCKLTSSGPELLLGEREGVWWSRKLLYPCFILGLALQRTLHIRHST